MAKMSSVYALFLLLAYASGEVVEFSTCRKNATNSESNQTACEIHEVTLDPCTINEETGYCKITPNSYVMLSFNYTPEVNNTSLTMPDSSEFEADSVLSQVYKKVFFMELPFKAKNDNACQFTSCPLRPGVRQSYTRAFYIPEFSVNGVYKAKLNMWESDNKGNQCCFLLPMELVSDGDIKRVTPQCVKNRNSSSMMTAHRKNYV